MLGTIKEYAAQRLAEAGEIGPGAAGASRLLHRARRDRGPAPAPRRAAGVARHARGRARQHQCRDARRARGRRGAGGDAARGGRRLVLVAQRAQGRGHRADHRGHRDARRGDRRDPGHGVRARRAVRQLRARATSTAARGVDPQGLPVQPAQPASSIRCWRLVVPLERMLQAPDAIPARVGAVARQTRIRGCARWPGCSSARCGSCSATADVEADAYLRGGARRVPGARRAVRDLVRADRAGGPDRHARRVRRRVRALRTGDRGRHRDRRHRRRHPDAVPAGPAVLAAGRPGGQRGGDGRGANGTPSGSPGRTRWPSLALSKAELARWRGDAEEAHRQLDVATALLGDEAEQANIRAADARPARLPRRRSRRGPGAPRGGLPGGDRDRARDRDRAGARRGRGPGAAPRSVRAGRAAARGEHRRARTAGSFQPGRGPDRAGSAKPPRRRGVRRGGCGRARRRTGTELVAVTLAS